MMSRPLHHRCVLLSTVTVGLVALLATWMFVLVVERGVPWRTATWEIRNEVRDYPVFALIAFGAAFAPGIIMASGYLMSLRSRSVPKTAGVWLSILGGVYLSVTWYADFWRSAGDPERGTSTGGLSVISIPMLVAVLVAVALGSSYILERVVERSGVRRLQR